MVASAQDKIKKIEQKYFRKDLPTFNVGDTVAMKVKVMEADKIRLHPFEGTVISIQNKGARSTFTVRKISFGEGVERVFPVYSPVIESLKIVARGKVQRSKLYYLRHMVGKKYRVKQDQATAADNAVANSPSAPAEAAV